MISKQGKGARPRRWLAAIAGWLLAFGIARAAESERFFAASLFDLDDQPAPLLRWQGQPLLVNFWARWCGPCKTEIPVLIQLRQRHRPAGLEVLGIAVEDRALPVKDFARAYEIDYPLLIAKDKGMELMKALGNTKLGLPFTVAIDRAGRIVAVKLGAASTEELERLAAAALGQ